jgi:cytochrome P450
LPLSIPTPYNQRVRQAKHLLETRLKQMIEQRRQHPGERNDLLSHLLHARDDEGQPMSDQQLIDECVTLFTAGHETTAAALTWTWYLLCKYPESYQKLQQEVDQELQGRLPTFDDLPRICIGNHLALMEGHLLIVAIAQHATFRLLPGQQIVPDMAHHLALRPSGKVKVRVHVR